MKDKTVRSWHVERFPDATLADVGIKLAEEAGEVCRAIDRINFDADGDWWANIEDEIGDCCIVLAVLAERFCNVGIDELLRRRFSIVRSRTK